MAGLMSAAGVGLPSELVTPFAHFATWITTTDYLDSKSRVWLFCAYKTADIVIDFIVSTVDGRTYYSLYDKDGQIIGKATQITRKDTIHLDVSDVQYIIFSGRPGSRSSSVLGTVKAQR